MLLEVCKQTLIFGTINIIINAIVVLSWNATTIFRLPRLDVPRYQPQSSVRHPCTKGGYKK
jgi:hypothetical protein